MNTLHIDILRQLAVMDFHGLPVDSIVTGLRLAAHRDATVPAVETALRDLADKSFATAFSPALGGTRWRITALGRSALQEAGL